MPEHVIGGAVQKDPGALVRRPPANLAFLELPVSGVDVGDGRYGSVVDVGEKLEYSG